MDRHLVIASHQLRFFEIKWNFVRLTDSLFLVLHHHEFWKIYFRPSSVGGTSNGLIPWTYIHHNQFCTPSAGAAIVTTTFSEFKLRRIKSFLSSYPYYQFSITRLLIVSLVQTALCLDRYRDYAKYKRKEKSLLEYCSAMQLISSSYNSNGCHFLYFSYLR